MKKLTITVLAYCLYHNAISQTYSLDYSIYNNRHYVPFKKVFFDSIFRTISLKTYYPDTSSRDIIYEKSRIVILKDEGKILSSQEIEFTDTLITVTKNNNNCDHLKSLFGKRYADMVQSLYGVGACKIEVSILNDTANEVFTREKILFYKNNIDTIKERISFSKENKKVKRVIIEENNYEKFDLDFSYNKKNKLKEIKSSYMTYRIFYKRNKTIIKLYKEGHKIGQLKVISSNRSLTFEYFILSGILQKNYFGDFDKYFDLLLW